MKTKWVTFSFYAFLLACLLSWQLNAMMFVAKENDIRFEQEMEQAYRDAPISFFENTRYRKGFSKYSKYTEAVLSEITFFPVEKKYLSLVSYEDSYGGARTYGGERTHEGCDIMALSSERGTIPIVSMTDGIVKNIGWLKLGGYRIGILSDSGMYYYYAHLDSYAPNIKKNDRVHAGQFIGMMGDTGYSEVEGTTGNFPVHLHLGIYYYDENQSEKSLNPFPFLKRLKSF